jgi:hypothetical protein
VVGETAEVARQRDKVLSSCSNKDATLVRCADYAQGAAKCDVVPNACPGVQGFILATQKPAPPLELQNEIVRTHYYHNPARSTALPVNAS